MQNYEQMRVIMNWERGHYKLGTNYKNKLAKRSVEAVKLELADLSREWDSVTFSVEPKGAMKIEGDRMTIFKKGE